MHVHARGGTAPGGATCPPELWAYVRWRARPEIVFKVYDSAPWRGRGPEPPRSRPYAESGRGFELVAALAAEYGGEWGAHRTRSRLAPGPVPGKAVFFTVPAPPGRVRPKTVAARQAAEEIRALLTARGIARTQLASAPHAAMLRVRAGMHIRVDDRSISLRAPGHEAALHAPYDRVDVAEHIIRHCADLDATVHC